MLVHGSAAHDPCTRPAGAAIEYLMSEPSLLSALVEMSSDGLMAVAPGGEIVSCNVAASRVFGFVHATAIGQPFDHVLRPAHMASADDRHQLVLALAQARAEGSSTLQLVQRR